MAHSLKPPFNDKDHYQGDIHAPLELVEYGDYQCPHCGRAYPIIKKIQSRLGKELKFVFRNFPLNEAHPQAFVAAIAAEAAGLQNAYWEMHDFIFEHQSELERLPFDDFASSLGLDAARLVKDLQDPALSKRVEADFESGLRSGVNGTPTFFINGRRYDESWDEESLIAQLKKVLAKG
jgi:protein-disulfide isomerase